MSYTVNYSKTLKKDLNKVDYIKARKFLFEQGYSPSSFKMPDYYRPNGFKKFNLSPVVWNQLNGAVAITTTLDVLTPKNYLSWRSFNFLNPYIFAHIVLELTNKRNWNLIKKILCRQNLVNVYSVPIFSLGTKETMTGKSISNFIQMSEKDLIKDCSEYENLTITDIKNFYPSIYTHSISWALHGKSFIKKGRNRHDPSLLGNRLDRLFQNSRDGQTNGIPVGSQVSDIIAEVILSNVDQKLSEKIKADRLVDKVLVSRYRDDYRILSKTTEEGKKVLQHLNRILQVEYDLHLNSEKTKSFSDIIEGSFRPWTLEIKSSHLLRHISYGDLSYCSDTKTLKDCLIETYRIQKKYPDGRASTTILAKLGEGLFRRIKVNVNKDDIPEIISILRKITLLREEVTPQAFLLLDILLRNVKSKKERAVILKDILRTISGKNDQDYQLIWFYRLCLSSMESMCQSILKSNNIPLLRIISRNYYKNDHEIFDTSNISALDKKELIKFNFIDRAKLNKSKNLYIHPDSINPLKY